MPRPRLFGAAAAVVLGLSTLTAAAEPAVAPAAASFEDVIVTTTQVASGLRRPYHPDTGRDRVDVSGNERGLLGIAPAPVRIMALGDSITGSPGCWRAQLWRRLQDNGFTDVDFVGTQSPQGCGFDYDGEHEGHPGVLVTDVAAQNQLPAWLAAADPDVVLMHFGTNDVWSNRPASSILAAYTTLVGQMRSQNPDVEVLVAQVLPMNPTGCAECGARVEALNAAIPDWAASLSTAQSPVVVVDHWTGFSTASDTYDGVHPNASGDQKMATAWYPALAAALG